MVYKFIAQQLLNFLLPVSCGLCNAPTNRRLPLCRPCQNELPVIINACPVCALPVTSAVPCGKCQQHQPAYNQVHALFLYQEPVKFLVQQFKFNRKLEYARLFSALIAEKIEILVEQPELIIPVPLHSIRLRKRGYNQAWELTKHLSRLTNIPIDHRVCSRAIKTPLQTGLKASERRHNLKQAFAITTDVKDRHICIVDDVMTTGSTLEAISSALKMAGAASVSGIVVARAIL